MLVSNVSMVLYLPFDLLNLDMWFQVAMLSPFTVGTGLLVRAAYPENFGKSSFFRQVDDDPDD